MRKKHQLSRRVKTLRVSTIVLMRMWEEGNIIRRTLIEKGLPKDAKVRDVRMRWGESAIELLVESDTFDEVPFGDQIPEMLPIIITTFEDKKSNESEV